MKRLIVIAAALGLAACAGAPDPQGSAAPQQARSIVPDRGLAPQSLEIGECGLFLWRVSGEPTFIFFSKAASGQARMLIGNEETVLAQAGAGGDIFGQFTTEQTWQAADPPVTVRLSVEPGEALIDGQRVPAGRLRVTDAAGWETIIPVAGVRACMERPDPSPALLR